MRADPAYIRYGTILPRWTAFSKGLKVRLLFVGHAYAGAVIARH